MKKVIALISRDCSEVKDTILVIEQRKKFFRKTLDDLDQQRDKVMEDYVKQNDEDWAILKTHLDSKNLIPEDYVPKKHNLYFSTDEDAVYVEYDEEVHPLKMLAEMFIKNMKDKNKDE